MRNACFILLVASVFVPGSGRLLGRGGDVEQVSSGSGVGKVSTHTLQRNHDAEASLWRLHAVRSDEDRYGLHDRAPSSLADVHRQSLKDEGDEADSKLPIMGRPKDAAKRREQERQDQKQHKHAMAMTMPCIMVLTLSTAFVYLGLAILRVLDDLYGRESSKWTSAFLTALRCAVYPPLLCMLFVACRMYVLSSTNMEGEPPAWVKFGMASATVGMLLEFTIVLLVPLAMEDDPDMDEVCFSQLLGEPRDVHPMIENLPYAAGIGELFELLQGISVVLLYGGIITVLCSWSLSEHFFLESPAIFTTCILCTMYFGNFLALMLVRRLTAWQSKRSRNGAEPSSIRAANLRDLEAEEAKEAGQEPLQQELSSGNTQGSKVLHAITASTAVIQKVPMIAVLVLAAALRAQELDPPYGVPPTWVRHDLLSITGFLALEALVAAYIGSTGEALGETHGEHMFEHSTALHFVRHMLSLATHLSIIPIVFFMLTMQSKSSDTKPLSVPMLGLLMLESLYFTIQMGLWCAFFLHDVIGMQCAGLRDSLLAADIPSRMFPSLCILFVAAEMYILQVSHHTGYLPGYAQECIYMCVFATVLQVACYGLRPIFTRSVVRVDNHGHPEYEFRPVIVAFAGDTIKNIALITLNVAVAAICVAVITTNARNKYHNRETADAVDEVAGYSMTTTLILVIALILSSSRVIGMAIKLAVESVDTNIIGTDITIKRISVSIFRGVVSVEGLVVENPVVDPEHFGWRSPALLEVGELLIDLHMWKYISSFGKEVEIEKLVLEKAHAFIEKPSVTSPSNIKRILDFLDAHSPTSMQRSASNLSSPKDDKPKPKPRESKHKSSPADSNVQIIEVSVKDIEFRAIPPPWLGPSLTVHLGDIVYGDLSERLKNKGGTAMDVIKVLLQTLLASLEVSGTHALKQILVHDTPEHLLHELSEKAHQIEDKIEHAIEAGVSTIKEKMKDRSRCMGKCAKSLCAPCTSVPLPWQRRKSLQTSPGTASSPPAKNPESSGTSSKEAAGGDKLRALVKSKRMKATAAGQSTPASSVEQARGLQLERAEDD